MVGRQTSGRCDTCRKRKIKCDRQRPACRQCTESGWACPGYDRAWVAHGPQTAQTNSQASLIHLQMGKACPSPLSRIPDDSINTLRSEFCWRLDRGLVAARLLLLPSQPYLSLLPERIGHSPPLDNAVRLAVSACHTEPGRLSADKRFLSAYTAAIGSLREAIASPSLAFEPNTLAAILMLQMVENYRRPYSQATAIHAEGLMRVIRQSSPANFSDQFSRAILNAELGSIVVSAILDGKDCFLEDPGWMHILHLDVPNLPTLKIMQQLAICSSPFSGLLRRYKDILDLRDAGTACGSDEEADASSLAAEVDAATLVYDLRQFQVHIQTWLNKWLVEDRLLEESYESDLAASPGGSASAQLQLILALRCAAGPFIVLSYRMICKLQSWSEAGNTPRNDCNQPGKGQIPNTVLPQEYWASLVYGTRQTLKVIGAEWANVVERSMNMISRKVLAIEAGSLS